MSTAARRYANQIYVHFLPFYAIPQTVHRKTTKKVKVALSDENESES